jgi:L-fuconolactonase
MPFGGNDWLALTQEPTLEPEIPICDPHHHFWDFRPQRIPYQRYLLHELADDINSGHNVRSTVFIEARSMYRADGPEEMRPVGEVEFVQGLAAASASGLYGPARAAAAIVGHANLNLGERVAPVLEALQAASPNRFRGIRHSVTWDPHPEVENTAAHNMPGQLASDDFRAGARGLARLGLSLEGWPAWVCLWRAGPPGSVSGGLAVLSPVAWAGGLGQGSAGPDHHLEPYRGLDKGRPLCQPGR